MTTGELFESNASRREPEPEETTRAQPEVVRRRMIDDAFVRLCELMCDPFGRLRSLAATLLVFLLCFHYSLEIVKIFIQGCLTQINVRQFKCIMFTVGIDERR